MIRFPTHYEFENFSYYRDRLTAGVLTRHTDWQNLEAIQKIFALPTPPISFTKQLHGTSAWIVGHDSHEVKTGDILITNKKNTPLLIRIADCASVLFFSPTKNVIANVHAGWRGIAQKALAETIHILVQRFGASRSELIAAVSPTIGPCCYQFTEPEKILPKFMHPYILEEDYVDLWGSIDGQLIGCGIKKEHVENPRICTSCNTEAFYSYRREGAQTGRFCTVIMLR